MHRQRVHIDELLWRSAVGAAPHVHLVCPVIPGERDQFSRKMPPSQDNNTSESPKWANIRWGGGGNLLSFAFRPDVVEEILSRDRLISVAINFQCLGEIFDRVFDVFWRWGVDGGWAFCNLSHN